jgi:sec-independent protein translocase protein TatC
MGDQRAPLIKHLEDLRRHLLICIVAVLCGGIISYYFIDRILVVFTRFFDTIVFIAPQEAFVTYIKVALFSGLLVSSPVVIFEVWHFIHQGLTKTERKHLFAYGSCSFILFIIGVVFCYYAILPWALAFLLSFQTEKIVPMITLGNLTSFCIMLLLSFGIVFEMPLAIVFLSHSGFITPAFLRKRRKYVIVTIFILSAMITPPDAITQLLLAVPLLGLYELSILFSHLVCGKRELQG